MTHSNRATEPLTQAPRKRRRRALRIAIISISSVALVSVLGALGAGIYFGADIPAAYAGKVEDVEERFPNPTQGEVVLTGSSFFELWTTSESDLEPLQTINVGIGGTKIGDQAAYMDRLVVPFNPRAVVVYAGSNDISGIPIFSKNGADVAQRVQDYLEDMHRVLPEAKLFYVAITEAPVRAGVRSEIQEANELIAQFASNTDFVTFIDTAPGLLTDAGEIDDSLFGPDRLHFNDSGYERFSSLIRPVLIDELS